MNRFASSVARLFLVPAFLVPLVLAGCESTSNTDGSTGSTASTTTVAKPTKPPKPKKEPLPPGLATGGLNDIETAKADSEFQSLYALNREDGEAAPVRVGLLVPLTGRAARAGEILQQAAELAVFDSGEKRLMLMPYDTESTVEGAQAAAEAAQADGVAMVLGPLFGAHVQPVAAIMSPANIPVLAFSNDQTAAGNGAAILGLTPENEIRRILGYAAQRGQRRIAAFLPDSTYGYLIAEKLREVAPFAAVEISRIRHYPTGAQADNNELLQAARGFANYDGRRAALRREISRLQSRGDQASRRALARLSNRDTFGDPPFDAVLLAEPRARLSTIAPLLAFYDVDPTRVQFLGMSSWYGEGLEREPTLINAVFPGPNPTEYDALMQRYTEKFDFYPGRLAALAYDAVAVAADMIRTGKADPVLQPDAILQPNGFAAYYGPFRVSRDGTAERLLSIMQVSPGGLVVIEPAPNSFDPLLN